MSGEKPKGEPGELGIRPQTQPHPAHRMLLATLRDCSWCEDDLGHFYFGDHRIRFLRDRDAVIADDWRQPESARELEPAMAREWILRVSRRAAP